MLTQIQSDDIETLREKYGELNDELKPHGARLEANRRDDWAVETFDAPRYYLSLETTYTRLTPELMALLAEHGLHITRDEPGEYTLEIETEPEEAV